MWHCGIQSAYIWHGQGIGAINENWLSKIYYSNVSVIENLQQSINLKITSGKHVHVIFTPQTPLYIAKLRYAWVYIFFLFLIQNTDCGYSLEPPRYVYPPTHVLNNYVKNIKYFSYEIFIFYI